MSSLANKYRPSTFEDVLDQDITVTILSNMIANSDFNYNYMFTGPAGCGKTTCARIFASKINGELIEVDGASHNGVNEIKDIINTIKKPSLYKYNYKVVIIDEAHMLTSAAWASLLIFLESHHKNCIFIFCTTDTTKIPDTILSRLMVFNFNSVSDTSIYNKLKSIYTGTLVHDTVFTYIAKLSNGNVREAISKLEKCIMYNNTVDMSIATRMFNEVASSDILQLFTLIFSKNIEDKLHACNMLEEIQQNGFNLYKLLESANSMYIEQILCNNINTTNIKAILKFILKLLNETKTLQHSSSNLFHYICANILVL